MTPEELEKLVAAADYAGIAKAAEGMSEAKRKKLSKTAAGLMKGTGLTRFPKVEPRGLLERLSRFVSRMKQASASARFYAAKLAVLAFCPRTTVKSLYLTLPLKRKAALFRMLFRSVDIHVLQERYEAYLLAILQDRKPDWIDAWVEESFWAGWGDIEWRVLRKMIKSGICAKPSCDDYVQYMVRALPSRPYPKKSFVPLSVKLLEDRDLLDDEIWRLFKVETLAFTTDGAESGPNAREGSESWREALCKLARSGDIDRQRLLDACLEGMFADFKNDALSGYIRLYERLEPTPEESAARQHTYLDLLSSSATHVVTFALNALKEVARQGPLDESGFLASVAPAMASRSREHAKAAITIIEGIAKRNVEMRPAAALVLVEALIHDAPDVQERAVNVLEKCAEPGDASLANALAERMEDVAASQRPRVEALLKRLGGGTAVRPEEESQEKEEKKAEDLLRRANALTPEIRRVSGVDDAVAALEPGSQTRGGAQMRRTLPPLPFTVSEALVLSGVEPIVPIADTEELLDAVAHAIEVVESADEVERILDGISRLCDQRPANFQRRTEPLVKRIGDFMRGDVSLLSQGMIVGVFPPGMGKLVMVWLRPQRLLSKDPAPGPWTGWFLRLLSEDLAPRPRPGRFLQLLSEDLAPCPRPGWFLHARLTEIAHRVARERPSPLLAAPTHAHGWVDPRVLVKRIKRTDGFRLEEYRYDLLQALIRLAPDHRADALGDASAIEGEAGRVVRWALGGSEGPTKKDIAPHAAFWLAAGRARAPHERLDELAECGIDDPGPDGIEPARYAWEGIPTKYTVWRTISKTKSPVSRSPALKNMLSPTDWPTAISHERQSWIAGIVWFIDWMAALWPQNMHGFFANGAQALAFDIESNASTLRPNCVFLRPLCQRDRPWSEMARLLALLGLAGRDADVRSHALDALTEAVADGRAHGEELGQTSVLLTRDPLVKLNRVVEGLREVARVSDVNSYVVSQILACWLKAQTELPRDAHHVLELLLELLTRCGIPLEDEARKPLKAVTGSSKTGKLARRLLEFTPPEHAQRQRALNLELLKGRLERAERWQRG